MEFEKSTNNRFIDSFQTRLDFMQLMMDSHKETEDENQEDKEHDKEFKEMYKGVKKRGKLRKAKEQFQKINMEVVYNQEISALFLMIVAFLAPRLKHRLKLHVLTDNH